MSRIQNSMRNILTSSGAQLLSILLRFITRTVFINTLGAQYLGITGLFSNILSILSLAELGVGSAITFNLYKPIAKSDQNQITSLMRFYKSAYRFVGAAIGIIGALLFPVLPIIIKDDLSYVNTNVIFALFLLQSVTSYFFFAYKATIIKANQREYIVTLIASIFSFISSIIQILTLLVFSNFILYISISLFMSLVQNMYIARKADSMYPYINNKVSEGISTDKKKGILKNCYAILLYNVNDVILNATDNIVLSAYIGLSIVGVYSNYLLIAETIKLFLEKLYDGVKDSIGNLHASKDFDQEYLLFKVINFFTFSAYGLASVGTFVVANEFITVWIGKEFVLSELFALLFAMEVYMRGILKFLSTFRASMGLFRQSKYCPLIGSVLKVVISIVLVQYLGISGVIIGTIISNLLTFMWYEPYVIYIYVFRKSAREYYVTNIKYYLIVLLSGGSSFFLSKLIFKGGIGYILVGSMISVIVTSTLILAFYRKTEEYQYIMRIIRQYVNKLGSKLPKKGVLYK